MLGSYTDRLVANSDGEIAGGRRLDTFITTSTDRTLTTATNTSLFLFPVYFFPHSSSSSSSSSAYYYYIIIFYYYIVSSKDPGS